MKRDFITILHSLKSPQNVGMIVRSHVAFGGHELIFTGHQFPWNFKKGSQAFSRKLEHQTTILHLPDPEQCIDWCQQCQYQMVALEIAEPPVYLPHITFPKRVALIVGNEASGLDATFLAQCDHIVTIPQFGPVGSLNVAVAASLAMYEFCRERTDVRRIENHKYHQSGE